MLVYKSWKEPYKGGLKIRYCDGWYLFGFLPLYIRKREP